MMFHKKLPEPIGKYFLALLTAQIIWAIAAPVIKITLQELPPFTFLFLRFLIVCIVILPYLVMQLHKYKIHPNDYINILLLGLFSQTAIIFIFIGLKFTSVLDTVIIGMLGPIMAMVAGHYFYREKFNKQILLGVGITIVGTLLVIFEPLFTPNGYHQYDPTVRIVGNFFVLLNSLSFVLYVIWSKISLGQTNNIVKKSMHFIHLKPMKNEYPASLLMLISFFVGMFTLAPFAFFENVGVMGDHTFNLYSISGNAVLGLLYMALLSSIVAYILYEWALNRISVTDSAVISYITPVFALPAAYLMLGEVPTKLNIIGGAIIAAGIVIAESHNSLERR